MPIKYIWNAIKIEASELKKGTFNVSVMTWNFFLFFKYLELLYQITYIFKPNVKIVFKLNRWNIYTIENYHALEPFWVWGSDKKCMKDWSLTNNKWILKFQKKNNPWSYSYKLLQFWVKKKYWFYRYTVQQRLRNPGSIILSLCCSKAMARTMNTWRLKKLNSIDFIKT